MKGRVDFYYYSNTGNTFLLVKEMQKVFEEHGIKVNLISIKNMDGKSIQTGPHINIGLAFPVAFQSTFPFIWDFFKTMPKGNGSKVFMLDSLMRFSGAIIGPLKRLLKQKDYQCIGAKEIIMPSNFFPKKLNPKKNKLKVQRGLRAAREYALQLIHEKSKWKRVPFLSDIFYKLLSNSFMMKKINLALGRKIKVDKNKCISCGLCSKICPVANITLDKIPVWSNQCQLCMRCLSFCPTKAIYIPGKSFTPYRAVGINEVD